jgi:hypothetical protein
MIMPIVQNVQNVLYVLSVCKYVPNVLSEQDVFTELYRLILIAAPTGIPRLSLTPAADLRAGDKVTATCESEGGEPHPALAFTLNGDILTPLEHQQQSITSISYAFEAKPAHHGARLTCSAVNRVMEAPVEAALQLHVTCKNNSFSFIMEKCPLSGL